MAAWMTATELSARFTVSEDRLAAYARRGNLAMRRTGDGSVVFDAARASQIFLRRGESAESRGFAILGASRLGVSDRGQVLESMVVPREAGADAVVIPLAPRVPRMVG
jgi:hypothetical protein